MGGTRGRTIVVLAKAFPPTLGGVETYSEQIVRAYLRAGYDVMVLTQTDGTRGWARRHTIEGEYQLFNTGPGSQLAVFRKLLAETKKVRARTDTIRGVHSTTWRVALVAQLVFPHRTRVVTVHGREVLNFPLGAGAAMRWVLGRATVVLCVSTATRTIGIRAARPRDASRWLVSFNGLTEFRSADAPSVDGRQGTVRLLSLCRLVPRKNIARAVEAVALLPKHLRENLDFRIAGRGPEWDHIRQEISRLGLSEQVTMLGFVPDDSVGDLYDWADIFVHPHSHVGVGSDFEGFGIAIADAMAHGCMVVSGRDGGPADFVLDGETGLLVDGNDVSSVARALERALSDESLRRRVADAGRRFASEHFSWDVHVRQAVAQFERAEASA